MGYTNIDHVAQNIYGIKAPVKCLISEYTNDEVDAAVPGFLIYDCDKVLLVQINNAFGTVLQTPNFSAFDAG